MSYASNDPAPTKGNARSGSAILSPPFLRGAKGAAPTKLQWALLVVLGAALLFFTIFLAMLYVLTG